MYFFVVQFSPWFKFYFPLFWGTVMYNKAMIMRLKQRKMKCKPRKKIEPQHNTLNNKALRWNISQLVWTLFLFVCLFFVVFPKGFHNVSHEFLPLYIGHSMKSRRSQSIGIKGFFNRRNLFNGKLNRFLQRSRNVMTVNVNIDIDLVIQ